MTFEKWLQRTFPSISNPALKSMLKDAYNAGQFALNSELGVAANESAKADRRKEAVAQLFLQGLVKDVGEEQLDAIIKVAQG